MKKIGARASVESSQGGGALKGARPFPWSCGTGTCVPVSIVDRSRAPRAVYGPNSIQHRGARRCFAFSRLTLTRVVCGPPRVPRRR